MINWYTDGMEITFTACHESNTGPPMAINGVAVFDVPASISSRLSIGQEIRVQNIDGVLHWYIDGAEVFQ